MEKAATGRIQFLFNSYIFSVHCLVERKPIGEFNFNKISPN